MAQRKRDASPARRHYRCRDGGSVSLACESEGHWKALAKCLGRPELAYTGSWEAARSSAPRGRLGRLLEGIFAADPSDVWLKRLQSHGVPCEPDKPANRQTSKPA
jgi:crotonobetainyl-CoA:carnitine CoA-transferase CaiB-like acyl-CoA transferase